MTFTLPGFSTFVREGIEITTGFTANIDATMTVGAVEETVTVSGASPIIDVQNVQHQENISRDTLDSLPTGRTYSGYAALTVGAQTDVLGGGQDVGGSVGDTWGTVIIHGSSTYDGEVNWDGMSVTASVTAGGGTGKLFFANQAAVQEVVMSTGGMDAETGFGAIAMNYIPKEGGNAFSYYAAVNGTNENLQWSNYGDELAGRGLEERQVRGLKKTWDYGVGVGGPIVEDRLWFYTAHRWWGTQPYTSLSYPNLAPRLSYGAADYQPDFDNPNVQDNHTRANNLRLTWQASERHKFTVSHDNQDHCLCQFWAVFGVVDYLASMDYNYDNIHNSQATWTFPASNRLLFEAGASYTRPSGSPAQQPEGLPTDIGVRIFTPSFINLNAQAFSPSTPALYGTNNNFPNFSTKASMSYVTGSHNLKVGLNTRHLQENHPRSFINNALSYDFAAPNLPLQINQFGTPRNSFQRANILGLFAQDQWTIERLTLNLGIRYDHLNGYVPAQTHPASRFVPSFSIDRIDNLPDYHDLNARLGAAYDLFGDGRTALKWNMGRYVNAVGTNLAQVNNPMESIILSSSRLWNDANGDLHPDCNLDNFGANGECGAIINPEFGKPIPTTRAREDVITGWNNRRANWQNSVAVQHEVVDGLSVEVAWFRRSNINFQLIDNLNIGPEHFSEFSITAPVDPNLGEVSGQTLGGLYTITPEGAALGTNNLIIPASEYGNPTEIFNGIDVSFQGRLDNGITLGGGMATGAVEINECYVVDDPDAGPARLLQLRAELGRRHPGQVQRAGAAAVRCRLLVRVPVPARRDPALELSGRRQPRRAGADRGADRPPDGHRVRGDPAVPVGHRVLRGPAVLVAALPGFHVPRQLHAVRAPALPARPAADEVPAHRRRPCPVRLRHLQRLQRERHHPHPGRLLDRRHVPPADGRHERPADQVRHDDGLLGGADRGPHRKSTGRGSNPPPFFCARGPLRAPALLRASTACRSSPPAHAERPHDPTEWRNPTDWSGSAPARLQPSTAFPARDAHGTTGTHFARSGVGGLARRHAIQRVDSEPKPHGIRRCGVGRRTGQQKPGLNAGGSCAPRSRSGGGFVGFCRYSCCFRRARPPRPGASQAR